MFNSTSDTKGTKDEETELTIAFNNMLLLVTLMRGLPQDSGRKKKTKLPPPTITTKTLARVDLRENTGEDTEKELRCCFHGCF